jgi:hypothetical protein
MSLPDLIGTAIGFLLTLAVFSYLIGDNPLFRLAVHLFVGVATGYVIVLALFNVLMPQLFLPLLFGSVGERALRLLPLLLGVLLLAKLSPRLANLGNAPMAYLVGVGAAAAIGGSVLGTIFPQSLASINALAETPNLINGALVLLGALATLVYFHFGARPQAVGPTRRNAVVQAVSAAGQVFIAITLGVFFAGVYTAALSAFVERVYAIWSFLHSFIPIL